MLPTSLIEAIIRKTDGRYVAKSKVIGIRWGFVTTSPGKDPLNLDRIRVWMPPWPDGRQSDWIEMLSLGQGKKCGIFFPPHVDDEVMLLCYQGDPHRMYYLTHSSQKHPVPDEHYVRDIPEQRWMIRTQDGHKIEIFDDKLEQQIKMTTEDGAYAWMDDVKGQRKIKLKDHIGQFVIFDVEKKEIEIKDWAGNHGLFVGRPGEEKIEIKDKSGNYGLWNAVAGNERIEFRHGQKNSFLKLLPSGNVILNADKKLILSGKEVSIWPTTVLKYKIPSERYICMEVGTDYVQSVNRSKITKPCTGENLTE